MTELEKTIKGLELCTSRENCADCPFMEYAACEQHLMYNALDALDLSPLQKKLLEQYHKVVAFLYAHGWRWE